jgi:hypothetical protein
MEKDSLGLGCPRVVVMSEGQEREAARLLALALARKNMSDGQRRSSGAMPVRFGGAMPVTTRPPARRRDRRRGSGLGRSAKADIGGAA